MNAKLEVRCDPKLLERIDTARGDASRSLFVRRAIERELGSPTPGPEPRRRPASNVTQTKVVDVLKNKAPENLGLPQFRCSVCGLKTIGGPCQKHPKASEPA